MNDRPNVVGDAKVSRQTPEQGFNPAAFAFPAFRSFGNSGWNILDGLGLQNINVSLVKQASLSDSMNLQFRAEFFNFFNRPNFDLPDIFVGSPTFSPPKAPGIFSLV